MKKYYMKVREKFISQVVNGNKKHEYRLALPERMEIKIADSIVLISNQNKRNFVNTTVKAKRHYKGWEEALQENWQQDFQNLYSSLEEALHECYKFYPKDQVDKYGIVVFDIEPLKTDYRNVSILLDTNIIIKRESNNNVSYEIATLFNWFGKQSISTYIHSATKQELSNYGDKNAQSGILKKLNSYNELPLFSKSADTFFDSVMKNYSQDVNGKIDNILLREVYDDNVGLLLTDDKLMLKKAEDLYIRDKVLSSAELLAFYEDTYPHQVKYKMLAVKLKPFGEVDLNSAFFNTLREDYGGNDFDQWYKNKARNGEKAYVFEDKENVRGFLYLKVEDEKESYDDITPVFAPKKRLKVGTFKIESTGFRLGERFLKIIFDNAKKDEVDEIYVTLFENKRKEVNHLKSIMEQWGFEKYGDKKNGEIVLVKTLVKYDHMKSPKFNYPLHKRDAEHFFLPIYPEFHTDLFPDKILDNENMRLYEDNKAHRYALEKIYLTGAYKIKAKPGDLLLIYRTGERYPKKYSSVVTGVAIIEKIIHTNNVNECIEQCKDRSIFSEEKILALYKKYHIVVKLLDSVTFENKVTLDQLCANRIVEPNSGPRPFGHLTKTQFDLIYKLGMEV